MKSQVLQNEDSQGNRQGRIHVAAILWCSRRRRLRPGRTYGWRASEPLSMRVKQVDLSQKIIRLEPGTTKNQDGREMFMTDAVRYVLGALLEGKRADDFVFTRKDGKPVKIFRGTWRKACEHAGVPGLLFHDLRRQVQETCDGPELPRA